MLGSNHHSDMKWVPNDDVSTMDCDTLQQLPSSPPKKKSMERLSRLFQKKSKHKKSLTEDMPEPPLYQPVSRHSSIHSTQSSYQPPSRINSTSKKGGDSLKRLASLRPNNNSNTDTDNNNNKINKTILPTKTVPELQQELDQKRQLLEQLYTEKQQVMYDNQRQEQDLARLEQKTQDRITMTKQLQVQYDTHLASMRATSDNLHSIQAKLIQLQHNIAELADRLLPYVSPDHTSQSLSSFWLNLRQVIEPMCPLSPFLIRHLTEKFIMDVLVQNFNLSEIAGCSKSDDYAQIALWFLDHDIEQHQHGNQYPIKSNIPSSLTSTSLVSSSPSSLSSLSSLMSSASLSEAVLFSIRLRQQVASTVVAAQQHQEPVKQQLQQVVQGHWKYLYGGLAKTYPFIYQHDTTLETDVNKHFGAQIQGLVEQAVALGFAIKGMELDITAADVQEGTQLLDPTMMDDVQGNRAGVIQFCISPPFKVVNQHEPLVKVVYLVRIFPRYTMSSSTPTPRLLHSPQKTNSRIVLVETNNGSYNNNTYQRFTLQEVVSTSPTYYGSASLSPRSSVASTVSTRSDRSSFSQSSSFSPPSSPIIEKDPFLSSTGQDLASTQPSWTASMDYCCGPHTPLMIKSDLPLGWLRPSLSATALLGKNSTGHPSHFVFLGYGQVDALMDVFGIKGPIPLDGNGISERSFFWQVDDNQQVMCTLATFPPVDGGTGASHGTDESPYLENLTLNRIGVTSILLVLPMNSTVNDIMGQLGQINKAVTGLDPQGTWWERLILVFYPGENDSCIDQRSHLVQTTLPSLMQHMPVLPCITIFGSPSQRTRRLLYQQACMHQTDHGWWHGSISSTEETSDSSDDDDGLLLPVAIMIGNKPAAKKKSPLFTVDTPPAPPPTNSSYAFLSSAPPSSAINPPSQELKHRFSKKWTEAPRRHHTKRSDR